MFNELKDGQTKVIKGWTYRKTKKQDVTAIHDKLNETQQNKQKRPETKNLNK